MAQRIDDNEVREEAKQRFLETLVQKFAYKAPTTFHLERSDRNSELVFSIVFEDGTRLRIATREGDRPYLCGLVIDGTDTAPFS